MKNFTLKTLFLSVLLCVSNWAGADNYVKITSTSDLESGKYLIVYEASNVAFNGGLTTLDATSNTIEVTISNKTIAASDETNAAAFTYDATDNSLKSASGYYIGQTKSANGLVQNESTKYSNVITFDESGNANITVTVSGSNVYLRYNKTSGQARFRYYKTGQEAIQLYKLVTSGGGEEPEPTAALSSIALSGTYPTTFTEGDAFSSEGMTVTATYEDESTKDVTANATFSGYDMEEAGTYTVTVSYTENEVTKTATYSITVNENVIPAHNVTWSTNGTTNTDSYKEGEDIEFPENPSNIGGNVFVGWAEESINGTTNSDPTFVTSAKMGEANITYYAVFATLVSEATAVDDELTNSTTGVSNNSYTEWSKYMAPLAERNPINS